MSVTFDPFMTLSLPIPGKKEKFTFFYIPYNIAEGYCNFKGEIFLRETDNIAEYRRQIEEKYHKNGGGFIITTVQDNLIRKMVNQNCKLEDITNQGHILLYEINPAL